MNFAYCLISGTLTWSKLLHDGLKHALVLAGTRQLSFSDGVPHCWEGSAALVKGAICFSPLGVANLSRTQVLQVFKLVLKC